MILVSCHYELSETQNSTPMNWRWPINLIKFSPMNWRMYLHEISISFLFAWFQWNCYTPWHFFPRDPVLYFYLRFHINPSHYKINSNLLVQQTTLVSQVLCSRSFLYQELHCWIKAKPPLISLIKRSLSTFINKCLIVIQRESTLTLRGLSWPWRKRFVPGIISFVSSLTSQIILNRVALFL